MREHKDKLRPIRSVAERNQLVEQNLRFVHYMAKRLQRSNEFIRRMDYDDVVQAGMLGLIRAAELWDASKGITFPTYAGHWVRSLVQRHIPVGYLVRVPEACFTAKQPTAEERTALESVHGIVHYDAGEDLWQEVPATEEQDWTISSDCLSLLDGLPSRHREALLLWAEGWTGAEIGERLEVTKCGAGQIVKNAVLRIRRRLEVKGR